MKIGVLTFHNTTNYGAVFQCYALQKYINEIGCTCEVIDYNNTTLLDRYDLNPFKSKNVKEFVKKCIFYFPERENRRHFLKFIRENIKLSAEKYDENNIKMADSIYDKFIAGSDQIWNFKLSGNDYNYFMTFSEDIKKRNSYAASFGSSKLDNEKEVFNLLEIQRSISVREDEAKELLVKAFPHVNQNIDPVFLLDKNQWLNFVKKNRKIKSKYIFVYEVARTDNLRNFAYYLAQKYNLKIVYLSKSGKKMKNVKKIFSISPEDFLNVLYNAEYVVTSSFHGLALSIIFEKNFFYDTPKDKYEFGSRLESLIRLSGIDGKKIINSYENVDMQAPNYDLVNKNLKCAIEDSKKYLKDIIEKV